MKKIYILLFVGTLSLGTAAFAQQLSTNLKPHASHAVPSNSKYSFATNGSRVSGAGYIDYSWLNLNDLSYVWQFNSTYVAADTAMSYAGVALNTFIGFDDYADNVDDFSYPTYPTGLSYTIDSIFTVITHENNSGTNNLFIMQIATLNASGALTSTSSVLWSDTIISNSTLSPGGGWLGTNARYVLDYEPGYTTAMGQKVGLVFKYIADKADTLGLIASCVDDGTGGTMTQSTYSTSYMQYPPFIPSISANRNIGYGSPVGSAGWVEAQDWEIWAHVTYNNVTGISDQDMNATLYQNMPNPAQGSTTVKYDLAKASSVSIVFYDLTGKKVKEINEGKMAAGSYNLSVNVSDLANGSYFYSLKTSEGVSLTKKMVVNNK
ncbi:MAG TPA: T9SS type A sorting domain-containing protein [Bacteroidia bacterium]|jgi:hypothetical protein